MAEKAAPKGWSDSEKVGLFLQIIAKGGPIPWPDLTLPEGRTMKACQVMVDKEKQKIKKAREAAGEDVNADQTSPKKRKTAEADGGKAKKSRKGKVAVGEDDAGDESVPEKNAKGTKKKASKAQADKDVDEAVKEESVEVEE